MVLWKCYTTIFSHAPTVGLCVGLSTVLCPPTGGKASLTEGCSFRCMQQWKHPVSRWMGDHPSKHIWDKNKIKLCSTSLVAKWIRVCLPMQGHRFNPWPRKSPHATEQWSPHHNYWSLPALRPVSHKQWAPAPQLLKLACPRASKSQLLSPCS